MISVRRLGAKFRSDFNGLVQSKFGRWVCGGSQSHVRPKQNMQISVNLRAGLGRRGGDWVAEWHLAVR
jgi:hypothetical protein